MTFDLAKAQAELSQKTIDQIQIETAYTWGARAIVAMQAYLRTGDLYWFEDATSYKDEAIEHAALAGIYAQFVADFTPLFPLAARPLA
jgi:hypothetical protein